MIVYTKMFLRYFTLLSFLWHNNNRTGQRRYTSWNNCYFSNISNSIWAHWVSVNGNGHSFYAIGGWSPISISIVSNLVWHLSPWCSEKKFHIHHIIHAMLTGFPDFVGYGLDWFSYVYSLLLGTYKFSIWGRYKIK